MNGTNPYAVLTPEWMAQLAQAQFRPPQLMPPPGGAPGMQMGAPAQPGFGMGMGDGMDMLSQGLAAWKPLGTPNGDPNDNRPRLTPAGLDPRLVADPTRRGLLGPI